MKPAGKRNMRCNAQRLSRPAILHDGSRQNLSAAILIVNFNAGACLRECLSSIARQTQRPSRVIVIDNGSTDGSAQGLDNVLPGVQIVSAGANLGFAAANNLGVRMADGCDWIALVNPDAFLATDWLAQMTQAVHESPDCAAFGSRLVNANDASMLDGTGDVYHVSGKHWRRGHGRAVSDRDDAAGEIFSPCAAAALYRREVFLEVGGFDEDFFCYAEDIDLGFRMRLLGHRSCYVPKAGARHVGSATTGKRSDFSVYHGHRNLVWVYLKNMPGALFWVYFPQHLLLNLVSLIYFTLRGQGRVIFRAKWDAIKGLPRVWRQRREIQARRKLSAPKTWRVPEKGLFKPYFRFLRDRG